MDVTASISRLAGVALGLFVVALLLCLVWIGGELHYGNCLDQAKIEGKSVSCSRWP